MSANFFSISNFGSLNPNLELLFAHQFSIANFSVPDNPEIGNIVAVGENQCQILITRPKFTNFLTFPVVKSDNPAKMLGVSQHLVLFLNSA